MATVTPVTDYMPELAGLGWDDISILEFPLVPEDEGEVKEVKGLQDLSPFLKAKGPQDLTAFLKATYDVNPDYSKLLTVGLFKHFGFALGVLFHKQGNRQYVLMDHAQFLGLIKEERVFKTCPASRGKCPKCERTYTVLNDIEVSRKRLGGKPHVEVRDMAHGNHVYYTVEEWVHLFDMLPCVLRYIAHLTSVEASLIKHIDSVMCGDPVPPPPQQANLWDVSQLTDEVLLYKRRCPT